METNNNLTLRDHIILRLLDKSLEYSDVFDVSDIRIAQIRHVADMLSTPATDSNIPDSDVPLDTSISVMGLPSIGASALERRHSVTTIGQLVSLQWLTVRRTRGLGKKSLSKIREFMNSHNLKFADE